MKRKESLAETKARETNERIIAMLKENGGKLREATIARRLGLSLMSVRQRCQSMAATLNNMRYLVNSGHLPEWELLSPQGQPKGPQWDEFRPLRPQKSVVIPVRRNGVVAINAEAAPSSFTVEKGVVCCT